jgi:hypothetical protein
MDAWDSTPRIAFLSPEPGSGKSRALEVTELLVPRPVEAVNVTPAYLFRKVGGDEGRPTILYDEIDTVFGPKARDNEEVRGLLNAGHRRHSKAGRCVVRGKTVETEEISAYCAVALAGLGDLPDTILTRSIIIRMRRRAPNERVQPYRRRQFAAEGDALRDRLSAWGTSAEQQLSGSWPEMPEGVVDRNADVWEAPIAVADAAGGDWPKRARVAAVALVTASSDSTPSLGIRLLADLRSVFEGREKISTDDIIEALCNLDESPWGDLRGKQIDARGLARRLRPYDIKPSRIRLGAETLRGYTAESLHDAWSRYLPPLSDKCATSATSGTTAPQQGGTAVDVADTPVSVADKEPRHTNDVPDVAEVALSGNDEEIVREWMVRIGEDDNVIDSELQRARDDPRVMAGFLELAATAKSQRCEI